MDISVVLPVYNEEGNLPQLYSELEEVLSQEFESWEIIFVDDGSTDSSAKVIKDIAEKDAHVKLVKLRKNFGQTPAIQEGLRTAEGERVVTMDSDLQNDPEDIPEMVERLEEGFDCVVGWRRYRKDPLGKRITSRVAAGMRKVFLETELHDYGCTLKVFTAEAAEDLSITGEMHRYIPPILERRGYTVTEMEVNHRERKNGETKYSWRRVPKGFIDMMYLWFWQNYRTRPMHVLGSLGILTLIMSGVTGLFTVLQILTDQTNLYSSNLPLITVFLFFMSLNFFVSGLKIDLLFRNFYQSSEKKQYEVEGIVNGKQKN